MSIITVNAYFLGVLKTRIVGDDKTVMSESPVLDEE